MNVSTGGYRVQRLKNRGKQLGKNYYLRREEGSGSIIFFQKTSLEVP
jgi:hypothetical protein